MIKVFNNINPNKLQDELIKNGIKPILIQNDRKNEELIAKNVWITFNEDVDINKVNEIVENLSNIKETKRPSEMEKLRSDVDYLAMEMGVIL